MTGPHTRADLPAPGEISELEDGTGEDMENTHAERRADHGSHPPSLHAGFTGFFKTENGEKNQMANGTQEASAFTSAGWKNT